MRAGHPGLQIAAFALISLAGCGPNGDGASHVGSAATPERIVTLAPHLAELVFAAGAGGALVGVSAFSDRPAEASALPVVGDAFAVDQERLALLRPDMLLAWQSGTPQHVVDQLRKRGYRVEVIRTRSLEDVATAIETIGELTGNSAVAGQAAAGFREGLRTLAARYAAAEPISVFYQLQRRPLYTINGQHYLSELIGLCGGQNIFSDLADLAPLVAVEAVIERNPEVMIVSSDSEADALSEWDRWPGLAANRYRNHFVIQADDVGRATPRLMSAAKALCRALDQGRSSRANSQ